VIGLGTRGRELVGALAQLPHGPVAALCDPYEPAIQRCKTLAPNAAEYADYRGLLADPRVRAVLVSTPTHLHRAMVEAALAAGKHVYCEAPLAMTLDDTRAIARAARQHFRCWFQAGLQRRADFTTRRLVDFILSGASGTMAKVRTQWARKQSWRRMAPNPEREQALNWRLYRETSLGLMGELCIHQIDQVGWFLRCRPKAVTGWGAIRFFDRDHAGDDRTVADTVQAVFEFPGQVACYCDATLTNSFEGEYEVFYGSDAAIITRSPWAWMVRETDAPLLGWEVYARKDEGIAWREAGVALDAGASKVLNQGKAAAGQPPGPPPLVQAMDAFLVNCHTTQTAMEDFDASYDSQDESAAREYLREVMKKAKIPAAGWKEGFEATVIAIKASEAVMRRTRVEFADEWFEVSY
jgi:predicted dehydrogenase